MSITPIVDEHQRGEEKFLWNGVIHWKSSVTDPVSLCGYNCIWCNSQLEHDESFNWCTKLQYNIKWRAEFENVCVAWETYICYMIKS